MYVRGPEPSPAEFDSLYPDGLGLCTVHSSAEGEDVLSKAEESKHDGQAMEARHEPAAGGRGNVSSARLETRMQEPDRHWMLRVDCVLNAVRGDLRRFGSANRKPVCTAKNI
jgi:hypothetical protein